MIEGRPVQIDLAVPREEAGRLKENTKTKREDRRRLYLLREGV